MEPSNILNWRRITPTLTTSGQPSEGQLQDLRAMGVTRIVNLGPHTDAGALRDEPGTVADLGMVYDHIPVDFEAPTDADFEAFRAVLEAHADEVMHVHCIYNARVSAFFYRYAQVSNMVDHDAAAAQMDSIWRPGETWAAFTGLAAAKGQKNRYKGLDY